MTNLNLKNLRNIDISYIIFSTFDGVRGADFKFGENIIL